MKRAGLPGTEAAKQPQMDVSNNATGTISKDVDAALAACKVDKLPSK